MKVRFNRSGQTVLNGRHVTRHDVCTVNKATGTELVKSGEWDEVKEDATTEQIEEKEEE